MNHPSPENRRHVTNPATDEPGADHPVATGVGVAGGAAAGAAVGLAGGPVGAAVGAVVGAVVGGLAGHTVGQALNPEQEDAYWREAHTAEPYYAEHLSYDDYAPAYRAGYESRIQGQTDWSYTRTEWERRWDAEHAQSRLSWKQAEPAVKAAWDRANRAYVQEQGS